MDVNHGGGSVHIASCNRCESWRRKCSYPQSWCTDVNHGGSVHILSRGVLYVCESWRRKCSYPQSWCTDVNHGGSVHILSRSVRM